MLLSPVSRRSFLRFAATASAVASIPIVTEAHLALAQKMPKMSKPTGGVHIDANENPLGPSEAARKAIADIIPQGGRYEFQMTEDLVNTFAGIEGLKPEYVLPYAGSSEPLQFAVMAYTSKEKSLVVADPGYEAPMWAAASIGAQIHKIPLTKSATHDVKAMVAADPNAGLIYICSPNNPTGTVTSRSDIEYALEHKPKGSILLVDEAYIHLSDAAPALDLVKADKDLIVLRTFSKLYGMAGIRMGFAVGRPDLLQKLMVYGQNSLPITAMAAAKASLLDKGLVPTRKKIIADIRNDTFDWLTRKNYSFVPSDSNCFMLDTKRPGQEIIAAMAAKDVYIGRIWPAWPTYVRITVGTKEDMAAFKKVFEEVMQSNTAGLVPAPLPKRLRATPFTHLS